MTAAMHLYPYVLLAHVCGVLGLYVAIGLEVTAMYRLRNAEIVAQVHDWLSVLALPEKVFPVSAVLILVSGVTMTWTMWGWTQPWIDSSLVVLVSLGGLAPMVTGRRVTAIRRAVARTPDGQLPGAVRTLLVDPVLLGYALVPGWMGLGVVGLMVLKPGWAESALVLSVALAMSLASGQLALRAARKTSRLTVSI
jgi:hypothetical protein